VSTQFARDETGHCSASTAEVTAAIIERLHS